MSNHDQAYFDQILSKVAEMNRDLTTEAVTEAMSELQIPAPIDMGNMMDALTEYVHLSPVRHTEWYKAKYSQTLAETTAAVERAAEEVEATGEPAITAEQSPANFGDDDDEDDDDLMVTETPASGDKLEVDPNAKLGVDDEDEDDDGDDDELMSDDEFVRRLKESRATRMQKRQKLAERMLGADADGDIPGDGKDDPDPYETEMSAEGMAMSLEEMASITDLLTADPNQTIDPYMAKKMLKRMGKIFREMSVNCRLLSEMMANAGNNSKLRPDSMSVCELVQGMGEILMYSTLLHLSPETLMLPDHVALYNAGVAKAQADVTLMSAKANADAVMGSVIDRSKKKRKNS